MSVYHCKTFKKHRRCAVATVPHFPLAFVSTDVVVVVAAAAAPIVVTLFVLLPLNVTRDKL